MTIRLWQLMRYIAPKVPSPTHLRVVPTFADFDAYRQRGRAITGTTWRKGHEFAYPDGMTEREWIRVGGMLWRLAQPRWNVRVGRLLAAWAIVKAVGL